MPREVRTVDQLVALLHEQADPAGKAGMARFGIQVENALGLSMPKIRAIGASTVKDHELALSLWKTGLHEARILAALIDKPEWVTREQCEDWAKDFASWDVVDQVTGNLLDKTEFADELVNQWSQREEEFVKRAAFSMIAWMSVHLKKREDESFLPFLNLVEREADDPRNFVKKAVSWALRQIGKRSAFLHGPALQLAIRLQSGDTPSTRWIGADAVRELDSPKIRKRVGV